MKQSFFIYGFHSIQAQFDFNPECIIQVFVRASRNDKRLHTLIEQFKEHDINISKVSKKRLEKLSKNQSNQGIVAEILVLSYHNESEFIEYIATIKKPSIILVLDSVQDPRNLGACLRSANAALVDCVVINKNRSASVNELVYKVSAGALNMLKFFIISNLVRVIKAIQKQDIWVIGLDVDSKQSFYSINLKTSVAIVLGAEQQGMRPLTKTSCDQLATIPMLGSVGSLNVAVATGIVLFEINRQRLQ